MTIEWLATWQPLIVPIMLLLTILLETARPLAQADVHRWRHARHNLGMTALAFGAFGALGGLKAAAAAWVTVHHTGALNAVALPWGVRIAASFLAIDLVNYLGHRLQHAVPLLWRFHRVHHSDPALDVTTTIRQHPGEGVIRYAFMAAFAIALGAPPTAFAVYRADGADMKPFAVNVVELESGLVKAMHFFLYPELFAAFGLPDSPG